MRATYAELRANSDIVVGSLLQLGTVGADYFADCGIPIKAVLQRAFETWPPADCPHCAAGIPIQSVAAAPAP